MKKRFEQSWATLVTKANPDGLWASAYHIKVAVRDGNAFWLSSGNWQSSNQPNVHPFGDNRGKLPAGFQKKYNRDYHAIIDNDKLASTLRVLHQARLRSDRAAQAGAGVELRAAGPVRPGRGGSARGAGRRSRRRSLSSRCGSTAR